MIVGLMGHAGAGKDTAADELVRRMGYVKIALADPLKRICAEVFGFTTEQLWGPSAERNKPDPSWEQRVTACETCAFNLEQWGVTFLRSSQCEICGQPLKAGEFVEAMVRLTPRKALQVLGTQWGRQMHPEVWIRYALQSAKAVMNGYAYAPYSGVDPELAYKNEPRGVVIPDVRFRNELDAIKREGGLVFKIVRHGADGAVAGGVAGHASEAEQDGIPDEAFDAVILNNGTVEQLGDAVEEAVRSVEDVRWQE